MRPTWTRDAETARRDFVEADRWEPRTDRTEELALSRPVPLSDAGSLTLEVRKIPAGPGAGGSWIAQVDVLGRLSNDDTVQLAPKSLPFRFGDGSSAFRNFRLAPPPPSSPPPQK